MKKQNNWINSMNEWMNEKNELPRVWCLNLWIK